MKDDERYQKARHVSLVSIAGNLALTVLKLLTGLLANSTALVADAFHSASDLIGTLILLKGMKIAHQPPDRNHPFGHHRAETITSEILAIILILTALGIGYEGFRVLAAPTIVIPGNAALYIVLISIAMKEGMYHYTNKIGREINSDAIIADAWHHRSDVLSSFAALIGIGGAQLGYPFMDPLAAMIVAVLILKAGISIFQRAVSSLMETAPSQETLTLLLETAESEAGVKNVEDLRVRQHGSKMLIDLKISVLPDLTVEEGHRVAARTKERLMALDQNIQDVLVHVNPYYANPQSYREKQ